ncbi:MAG: STAS domain-containing protein [Sandaracinaceae bacterium]|nr:STAS domain-containing protein [Sandaracinaceae bacterium]
MNMPHLGGVAAVVVLPIPSRRLDGVAGRVLLDTTRRIPMDARIVIDLSSVRHLDSLGIASLCRAARGRDPGSVVLAGLEPEALVIARITRLHEVFAIYTTVAAAERALGL